MAIRTQNLFDPASVQAYKVSRTQLELFVDCPRCFYLDRRLGVSRVSTPPFTLNSATDVLLKKEFDSYRQKQLPHPIALKYQLDLVPYSDSRLDQWRTNSRGIQYLCPKTNLLIAGAIDDLWLNRQDQSIYLVDYKSTSTTKEITLADKWKEAYKRQMEVYQWLLRRNSIPVQNRCYFLFVNGVTSRTAFDNRLDFEMLLIPYDGNDAWVGSTVQAVHDCLRSEHAPPSSKECSWCAYRDCASKVLA